jgi:large subunit ribosomal protein L23
MKSPYEIIETALLTEKSSDMKANGKYVFKVRKNATKIEIKNAVEKLYDVKVKSVNTVNVEGKNKRAGKMMKAGKRPDSKKAIVSIEKGEINFF